VSAELVARLGGPVAAGGLALLVLSSGRWPRLAGLGLWAVGMALFVPLLAPSGHRPLLAVAALLGAGLAILFALVFRRWPWAVAFLTVAFVPARIPITVGDESANLLVPLYAVVAGAALALGWSLWRGAERRRELGLLSWPIALFVGWLGFSLLWSEDPKEGAVELFFFVLPFALLTVVIARLPWSERLLARLGGLLVAMGLLFAAVGIGQWVARDVFWNPKVERGNANALFFRVNSLFWDPSMYGRFVTLAILVAVVLLLFAPSRRRDIALAVVVAALWVGLLFTFSQSSFAALVAGVLVIAAVAWRRRAAVAVGLVAALMISVGVAAPELKDARRDLLAASTTGLDRATGGRFELVSNGLRIAADRPFFGVGVGGFTHAYEERFAEPRGIKEPASHTTPVTVAAETGLIGLALFAWLLAAAGVVAFRPPRTSTPTARLAAVVAGVGLATVFVHSLAYNAFFEDPLVWGFLALAALAVRDKRPAASSRSAEV
jgi:O-antigen ligase